MVEYWCIKQNPYQYTDETQMKNFIMNQQVVTCPFGHFEEFTKNVISRKYNKDNLIWSSRNQDKTFIESVKINDIILIPFRHEKCIFAKIISDPIENFETGLFVSRHSNKIEIMRNKTIEPFRPIVRRIQIIKETNINPGLRWSICKSKIVEDAFQRL